VPGEIVNTLGFEVGDALDALARLDGLLQQNQTSFERLAGSLSAWNTQASTTIDRLRQIVAAAKEAVGSLSGVHVPTAAATAATTGGSSLWLPAGVREEVQPSTTAAAASTASASNDAVQKLNASLREGAKLYEATRTPQERYNAESGRLKQLADSGAISQDTHTRAIKQAGAELSEATKQTNKWTVSWETLARVVVTQLIVRTMSQIRDALKDAVTESIEFQRRVAEIGTVAPSLGGSFAQLTNESAEFAKNFNIPLAQATEGLYQTISDQFDTMSERSSIMEAAMKLAKVGVMDFGDATTLLTGTLNAFGMTADQADSVAAKFFTTIKLGHVRGKELADIMGQLVPIASQLGISLDEVNAAMVSLTIGGQDAHKSATGLRGAMVALLKPSEDMKKVIREMGFSSPEQLVGAKGMQGAFLAVAEASNNMASEIGKSVRNVRALTAELRLTQAGAAQVEEAMKAMELSTPDMLNKIYKQFTSTDSEKLTSTINRLKIDLTQDFGASLTGALATMLQVVGGADRLSAAIQAIGFAAIPAGIALGVLAAAAMTAQLAMGPVGWTLLAASAALSVFVGGMSYMTATSINETRRLSTEQHQATIQFLKDKDDELRNLREVETKKMTEENRSWENRASVIRKEYFGALDDLRDKNKVLIESDRQAMESIISSQSRVVSAYRNAANQSLRIVQESERNRSTLEAQYSDQRFKDRVDKELKLNTQEKALATLRRSWDLQSEANKSLSGAQTEDDIRRAQAIQQRAKAYLEEGTALAKESGDAWLVYQAERSVTTTLEDQIKAQKQLERLQSERAQNLAREAAKEQERLDEMKTLMKVILLDLQAFDKQGAKTPKELAEQQAKLTENIGKFRDTFLEGKKVDVSDLLGLDQLQRRVTLAMEGGVSDTEVKKLYSSPETFADFRKQIEKGIGPVQALITTGRQGNKTIYDATKGMTAEETIQHFSQVLQQSKEVIAQYDATSNSLTIANLRIKKTQGEITKAMERWHAVGWVSDVEALGGIWEMFTEKVQNTPIVKQAREEFQKASLKFTTPNAEPLVQDLAQLKRAYDLYVDVLKPSTASKAALDEFMTKAEQATEAVQNAKAIERGLGALGQGAAEARMNRPAMEEALKAAEDFKKKTETSLPTEKLQELKTNAESFKTSMSRLPDLSVFAANLLSAAGSMGSIASSAGSLSGFGVMTAATGGTVWDFLAGGGRPRGTDTRAAMLTPGEVVMNERAAQRFSPQLIAMNAGMQPSFHSEGGTVTNIGDINVTVSGGGSSRQTARSIASELRRELRRGTSTL